MMHWLFALALIGTLVQDPLPSGLHNATIDVDEVGPMTYGIWVPRDYDAAEPVPLVLALHPGGSPGPGYGMQFLRGVVGRLLCLEGRLQIDRSQVFDAVLAQV